METLWKLCGLKMSPQQASAGNLTKNRKKVASFIPLCWRQHLPFIRHDSLLFHVATTLLPHRQSEHFQTSTRANFLFPRQCAANNSWRVQTKRKPPTANPNQVKKNLFRLFCSAFLSLRAHTPARTIVLWSRDRFVAIQHTQRGFWNELWFKSKAPGFVETFGCPKLPVGQDETDCGEKLPDVWSSNYHGPHGETDNKVESFWTAVDVGPSQRNIY